MASKKTIEIVKSTAPVLEQHGETITKVFYARLFENHPSLKSIFNMTNQKKGGQQKALANAVFQYACHIDKLEMLGDAVESIAQKHASFSISKELYPIVGQHLLEAIKEVLGEAATPEIINAWAEAYGDLATIFVSREEEIYTERENVKGGFRGLKEFVIIKKVKESDAITSFYLKRKDGTPVPEFLPGQYVALTIDIPNEEHKFTRNYSLSDAPLKDYIRMSVKKEANTPEGIVSNYLHSNINVGDSLPLGMPSGEFVLKNSDKPLVLISGGVGVTPLMSMYNSIKKDSERPVFFVQCALNSAVHAFEKEIKENLSSVRKSIVVYSEPMDSDKTNKDCHQGFLTLDILKDSGITSQSDFYFCGPKPFMQNTLNILKELGVEEEHINFEFFGHKEELV